MNMVDLGGRSVSRTAITPPLPFAAEGWGEGERAIVRRMIEMA